MSLKYFERESMISHSCIIGTVNLILTVVCVVCFCLIRPKRYLLGDLVDWIYAVMRKDRKWGYIRYDMRFDPLFLAKTWFTQNISPSWPVGLLYFEGLELVRAVIVGCAMCMHNSCLKFGVINRYTSDMIVLAFTKNYYKLGKMWW